MKTILRFACQRTRIQSQVTGSTSSRLEISSWHRIILISTFMVTEKNFLAITLAYPFF
jgi:hypothetical protein